MDPISLAIIGGAVGGATSTFLQKAMDSGGRWFDEYVKDHQRQAVEKANANVIAFLEILKRKIERLEADAAGAEEQLNRIRTAMDEPDFAFCFKAAMLQAARTSDSNKQTILARLVAERLSSGGEGLLPIVIQQACECVGMLTSNHLHILALCTWFQLLKRENRLTPLNPDTTFIEKFLLLNVRKLAPVSKVTETDFLHLSGVSCVHITGRVNVIDALNGLTTPSNEWNEGQKESILQLMSVFCGSPLFSMPIVLTCKGLVIGACACDALRDSTTDLKTMLE